MCIRVFKDGGPRCLQRRVVANFFPSLFRSLLPARLRVHLRFYLSLVRLGRNPGQKEREVAKKTEREGVRKREEG